MHVDILVWLVLCCDRIPFVSQPPALQDSLDSLYSFWPLAELPLLANQGQSFVLSAWVTFGDLQGSLA